MSTVTLRGITMGYTDEGSGAPLVLVHGHPFDRSMWAPQVASFASAGWRVIAPDLRGYGASTVVPGRTPLRTFAEDIAALTNELGVAEFVLGGLSMGGQIVLECYRRYPQRIRGLVLADTFAAKDTEQGRAARIAMADRLVREGMAGYAAEVLTAMIAPHNVLALPAVAEQVLRMMRDTAPEGAAAALRGRADRPDYLDLLTRVRVPTLVVVGSEDEYTPVADATLMHERIPQSTLAVVPGAAHLPNLERRAEFDAVLAEFLHTLPMT